ncbi:MAG: hypothetical protein R2705_22225 [Ilumatobacteraceae bacterium]
MSTKPRVRFAVLAHQATMHEGMVSMLDAGWTSVTTDLPRLIPLAIALQTDALSTEGRHDVIRVAVHSPEGDVLAESSTLVIPNSSNEAGQPPDPLVVFTTLLVLPVEVRTPGIHSITIGEAVEEVQITFNVRTP